MSVTTIGVINPWSELPTEPPFVLASDAAAVRAFNARAHPEHTLQLEVLPEPFLGDPEAPLVLLGLNPGFDEADVVTHRNQVFAAASRRNLVHAPSRYPFYLLDPALPSPGRAWWCRHLRPLIERFGTERVASSVFVIEWIGYHSVKFAHHRLKLASQTYARLLVTSALVRGRTIIVQRGLRAWQDLVPELQGAGSAFCVRNWQNPVISERNCPDAFAVAANAIARTTTSRT